MGRVRIVKVGRRDEPTSSALLPTGQRGRWSGRVTPTLELEEMEPWPPGDMVAVELSRAVIGWGNIWYFVHAPLSDEAAAARPLSGQMAEAIHGALAADLLRLARFSWSVVVGTMVPAYATVIEPSRTGATCY